MNNHGLPTSPDYVSKKYCQNCSGRLSGKGWRVCSVCAEENLEISQQPMEERQAYWDNVVREREERRLKNTFIERAGYAAQ